MSENDEFEKFLITTTNIEKQREFDRKVDRIKKSSSATTVWAIIPGLIGIHGIANFYLNRPLEGLVIFLAGLIPGIFSVHIFLNYINFPFSHLSLDMLGLTVNELYLLTMGLLAIRVVFFIGNIIYARYQYSRYDSYIYYKAKKPWNNWGLNSQT